MSDRKLLRLVGRVFTGSGLAMLLVAFLAAKHQCAILNEWPEVQATVTRSRVLNAGADDDDGDMYKTEVEFRYQARGREYTTPGQTSYASSSYPAMKRKADAYPPGSRHPIKYDPNDPNDIRFGYGYTAGFFFLPLIFGGLGVLFTGVGVPLWYAGRRRRRPEAFMDLASGTL